MVFEYILLAVLFIAAIFIVVSVTIQKTHDEGLGGTISGSSETYYSKDKSVRSGRLLQRWTLIACIVFAVAVVVAYVIQPDFAQSQNNLESWQNVSEFAEIFK